MKIMICEMCGSQNLLKQDGVFVCQHCGTRYSVEEARKMMTDGPVDVSGSTVKIDSTDKLANLYQVARRAKADNNYATAEKYYDMILQEDPRSWEAVFYNTYFTTIQTNIANIASAATTLSNCLRSSVTLLKDSSLDEDAKKQAILEMVAYSYRLASAMVTTALDHYRGISQNIREKYTKETIDRVLSAAEILLNFGNQIEDVFGKNSTLFKYAAAAWRQGVALLEQGVKITGKADSLEKVKYQYMCKIAQCPGSENDDMRHNVLSAQIEQLDNTIKTTPTKRFGKNQITQTLFPFLLDLWLIRAFFASIFDDDFYPIVFLIVFAGICFLSYCTIVGLKPYSKEAIEKNKSIVAEATKKRDELQAELDRLQTQKK